MNVKILDLIFSSIIAEGGDGDALWLTQHTSLNDLVPIIEKYNKDNNTGWKIEKQERYISWGLNQEWATITDYESFFNKQPNYITLKIKY